MDGFIFFDIKKKKKKYRKKNNILLLHYYISLVTYVIEEMQTKSVIKEIIIMM